MKHPPAKLSHVIHIFIAIQLLFFSLPVLAVFKCTSNSGNITYQDEPCNDKTSKKMEHVGYKSSRPLISRVDAVCKLRRGFNGYIKCLREAYVNFNVTYDVPASEPIIDEYLRYIHELESQVNNRIINDTDANYRLASKRNDVHNKIAPIIAQHMHKEAKERADQESQYRQAAALDAIADAQRRQAEALENQVRIERFRQSPNRQTHCTSYINGEVINTSCY